MTTKPSQPSPTSTRRPITLTVENVEVLGARLAALEAKYGSRDEGRRAA